MSQHPAWRTKNWSRFVVIALCSVLIGAASAARPDSSPSSASNPVAYQQIDQREKVAAHFTSVSAVSLAMVAVPDPRVPRHRRAYDLSVVALIQGMLDAGYVLDRYSFPWRDCCGRRTRKKRERRCRPMTASTG